ncbi:hypothetical protein WME90_11515 [Sorangium sp. So ce375]|uniref:hypothetical protein n=1 Tax=Sorangium sp. So ce375 TaxID=3133306 RepID=UPI003F5B0FC4
MMSRDTSDTSVTFSLAELAKLEEARVREEHLQRARARDERAREQREAEARQRAAEAARVAAETEAQARREREQAETEARADARARAAIEVARIEAEAKARLEADNAARAHELAVVRARAEGRRRGVAHALAAALGLVLCGGAAGAYGVAQHVAGLEQEARRLREAQAAQVEERESARAAELAALDRRHAALRGRPLASDAEEARAIAEAARNALDPRALDHNRLRAFGDALDALEARLDALERIAALDRRHADLAAWAAERRRPEATAAAQVAAARARTPGADEGALRAYESALAQLREALARPAAPGAPGPRPQVGSRQPQCSNPGDPMCSLDGRPL